MDEHPDGEARRMAFSVYERFRNLDTAGQETDGKGIPFVRFTPPAAEVFAAWREDIENRLRAGRLPEAIEGHLSKYRSLVPSLALILHLADNPVVSPVGLEALQKAIRWAGYLFEHAQRIYGSVTAAGGDAVQCLAGKLLDRKLPDGFTARDIKRPKWAGLSRPEDVDKALLELEEAGWLRKCVLDTGGRPKTIYAIHPEIFYTPWKFTAKTDTTPRTDGGPPPFGSYDSCFTGNAAENATAEGEGIEI